MKRRPAVAREWPKCSREDMWTMLLLTVRYSMGRATYMSELAPSLVLKYRGALYREQLQQIRREVGERLGLTESEGRFLGWSCDHESWKRFVENLNELIPQTPTWADVYEPPRAAAKKPRKR